MLATLLLDGLAADIRSFDFEFFGFDLAVEGDTEDASVASWEGKKKVGAVGLVVMGSVGQCQRRKRLPFGRQSGRTVRLAIDQRRVGVFQKRTFLEV